MEVRYDKVNQWITQQIYHTMSKSGQNIRYKISEWLKNDNFQTMLNIF